MEPLNEQSIGCEDNDSWTKSLVCDSCGKRGAPSKLWVCRDCFEEIHPEIEELQVKKEFLILPNEPNELFPDFKLIVKDEDGSEGPPIACHKKILVDRSPVFDAMLRFSSESKTGTVIIEEASYEAVKIFVEYLYKGKESLADQLDHELARKLFVLADRYQVMHLKDYFEDFIVSHLTWDNSLLSCLLGRMHNSDRIVEAVMSLMRFSNSAKVRGHPHYKVLTEVDETLAREVLEAYRLQRYERIEAADTPV